MKPNILTLLFSLFFIIFIHAQEEEDENGLDTWTIGLGAANTLMHGDLTSLNSVNNEPINIGFYLYVSKMVSPAFGFEVKAQVLKFRGASQEFSSSYPILFPDNISNANDFRFEGDNFGGEINAVINLSGLATNPYANANRRLNFTAYLGVGFHTYDSKLFDLETDELLIDFGHITLENRDVESIYYTSGLGIRYKLSKRFDLELRQTVNFNSEDHLDAAITQKQTFEAFFVTNLGLVFKLNKKGSESVVWQYTGKGNTVIEEVVEEAPKKEIKLDDTDGDGVIDQFDVEPNTPKGAVTYGNGVAIDTDKDGVIDLYDKCPLVAGAKGLDGCPIQKDTDGDGVIDKEDLCPTIIGPIDNQGCPIATNTITEVEKTTIINLAKNIYFPSGKSYLVDSSKSELDKIAQIMLNYKDIKFVIEGHTDSGGKRIYNLKLSQDRADTVKEYLINFGVDENTLKSIGYGFSKPKFNNFTSDGRQLNRRVEIKVQEDSKTIETQELTYTYIVVSADTLFSISKRFNVTVDQLKDWNKLTNNILTVGQKLIILKKD